MVLSVGRSIKLWLAITLFSLLVWLFYWLTKTPSLPASYIESLGMVFWAGFIGQVAFSIGAILGLIGIFRLWGLSKPFMRIKGLVAAAVLCSSLYYLGFIPSAYWLMRPDTLVYTPFLGAAYLLQVLLTAPFFVILAVKLKKYEGSTGRPSLLKWSGIAFFGFTGALWANAVMRWLDMLFSPQGGATFLFSGIRALGFFDSVIFMSLALVFAAFGCYRLVRQKVGSAGKWLGWSMAMVGLQYIIFLVYAYSVNVWSSALLTDVWTVTLFGLGISVLIQKNKLLL